MKAAVATDTKGCGRVVSFETRRASREADRIIEHAGRKAKEILASARKQALDIQNQAERRGIQSVKTKTANLVLAAESYRSNCEQGLKDDLVEMVIAIAEHLIRSEIRTNPSIILKRIEQGLGTLQRERAVKLHLHPDGAGRFTREISKIVDCNCTQMNLEIVPDTSLDPGDCRFHAGDIRIDMTIHDGLRVIRRHLLTLDLNERR